MNKPRFPRLILTRAFAGALLFSATAFAITPDELASLRTKAENGNAVAQYNLGLLYKDNRPDAPADPVEAYIWLSLAASNGATGPVLSQISSQLSPAQLEEAKGRLERRRADLAGKRSGSAAATRPVSAAEPVSPLSSAASDGPLSAPEQASSALSAAPSVLSAPIETQAAPALLAEQKKLSAELATAWKEIDQLKAELGKAGQSTTTIDQLKRERDQLASTLATVTEETTKLRTNAANFEGERNALQQKADAAAQQQKEALMAELAAANTKLKGTESELARVNAAAISHDATKQALDNLTQQVQKLS